MLKCSLLFLLFFIAPFSFPLSQNPPPPSSATPPRSTIITTPNDIVKNYPRARFLVTDEEICELITAKYPNLRLKSKVLGESIEETSYGLFDNLPLSLLDPSDNNKVKLYNKSKRSGFETALREISGYEILAAVVEPSMIFVNSCTVVGGGAIIANFDKMDCQMVECTTSEALQLASTKPLFVDPKTFVSPTPLLDEESSPLPNPPPYKLTKSQYTTMSPTTKATFLLYDLDFNPRNIPRCRYVETKQGREYVESRLLPLLDSTVRKSLNPPKSSSSSFISKKQFAADRRDEASRNREPALAKMWNEEFLFLRSLQYDPTSDVSDILNDKDEWYAKNIRNSAPVSNLDELLKGTGLQKADDNKNDDIYT